MLKATSPLFAVSLPNCGVEEPNGNVVAHDDDDTATLLASDNGSDTGTCSTQTALLSDGDDEEGRDDAPRVSEDGAAHDVEAAHCGGSQSPRPVTNTLNKALRTPAPFQEIYLVRSTTPLQAHMAEGERTVPETVGFPQLCVCWELCAGAKSLGAAQQFLIPAKGEVWWASAGAPPPPARLTCVYQVGRSEIPEALSVLKVPQSRYSVSRMHCEVRLHFCLTPTPSAHEQNATTPCGPVYRWNSFDVADCYSSNGTLYHAVRLLPSHRYSFSVESGARPVELMLGDHYRLSVQTHDTFATAPEEPPTHHSDTAKLVGRVDAEVQWTTSPVRVTARAPPQVRQQTKKSVVITNCRRPAQRRKRVDSKEDVGPFIRPCCSGMESEAAAALTIVTTGIRLTPAKQKILSALGIRANPAMSEFSRATLLVIEGPLMRSVKLLTALPYVQHIVDRGWLDATLALAPKVSSTSSSQLKFSDPVLFPYSERRTRRSIETANGFSLQELIQVPVRQRQALFAGQVFWVHPAAEPQDPPDNDLNYVILASGGTLTKSASTATVAVMPQVNVTSSMWRQALTCPQEPLCIFVVPNDIFCAVLQQRRPTTSTVRCPVGVSVLPPSSAAARPPEKRRTSLSRDSTRASKWRCT
ncbi:hypothetical protein TraAM80_03974 [Trypanosoma rangeli]|uniref:FHA domain-containing protein n=1 Tax=Trypanosoma rangeli TaxID=5698 RepID=A0A422NM98_TRYRA|nr:uncharacterized protein TraAM80_03974 [Trypanosoma rangeli]RNF06556.1 hypothetical protein TraAM80_03974 [Trypanosoma rangeli]|eukprot:RNF06556.1 hypothetical protein TraAM80_03974 [Trypanosoma rangeli]